MNYHLIAAAILGLLNSGYLLWKRYGSSKPLVCPIGQRCQDVLDSRYGRLLGIRNEFLGSAYYIVLLALLITAERGRAMLFSIMGGPNQIDAALLISIPAAAVSVALTLIQAFWLKNWCSYCLFANAINVFIFAALLFY